MQIQILTVESTKEPWFQECEALYQEKLRHYCKFERTALKSKTSPRESSESKVRLESEALLQKISRDDFVILCDEHGKNLTSEAFAKTLVTHIESRSNRILFVIGGAFGVSDDLKKRANLTVSLAPFVLNHLMAQAVLLEQIYRAT